MNIDIKKVKIVVTVPCENLGEVRNTICDIGAGVIGEYSYCSTVSNCIGTFKPSISANPYIGERNKIQVVEEEKLEVCCDIDIAKSVIQKLREIHPYEEPAIDIIPLISEEDL